MGRRRQHGRVRLSWVQKTEPTFSYNLLTVYSELGVSTAHSNAGRDVDGYTAEWPGVQRPVDRQYTQVTAVLVASTGVGQAPVVQGPVKPDELATGHVTAQSQVLSLDDDLADRRRVKVEAVLTAAVSRQRYTTHIKSITHIYAPDGSPNYQCIKRLLLKLICRWYKYFLVWAKNWWTLYYFEHWIE